ncbi:DMT family transporter [Anaeroselena agilis]|uniref:DMT family transporter n=1 Tax=Anaeroselena agilis TaxID=3063788 RepID=A0ABU3NXS0_9FIRM|nr:DMT family transporter [Selenomonadales bacterium 4137-cl]
MTPAAPNPARKVELILLAIVFIWGVNTPVMKIGLSAMDPLVYNALRLVVAALISGVALVASHGYRPMSLPDLRHLAAISVFGLFVNQVFIIYGMNATTAGNAALVLATLPVNVALINRVLGLETLSPRTAAGIVVSFAGVLLAVLGAGREISLTGPHLTGAALILVGQLGYSYYTVSFRRLTDRYSLYQIITGAFTVSAVLFVLIAVPDLARTDWAAVPAAAWQSVVFSSVFALALANITWIWAVKALGSTRASLFPNICPVISIVFAGLFLDETFGLLQAAGAVIIFLGLWLSRRPALPPPAVTRTRKG